MPEVKKEDTTKKPVDSFVREVTPGRSVTYGGLVVGFYDNPREYVNKDGETIQENRLYIDIATPNAKQQHVRRKAKENETKLFNKAYSLYLRAKENGDVEKDSFLIAAKDKEIEELRKQLAKKQNATKNKDATDAEVAKAASELSK